MIDPTRTGMSALPAPLARFIGRERDLQAVTTILRQEDVRLLTLAGPGGVGKSRLAVEVGRQLDAVFDDGVAFVSLASLRDPSLVLSTVARTLGVGEAGHRSVTEAVVNLLRDRRSAHPRQSRTGHRGRTADL